MNNFRVTLRELHSMKKLKYVCALLSLIFAPIFADPARADTFGSGANTFDISFVTIGNPGNTGDTKGSPNPAGSVPYTYRLGKFEVSEQMIDNANALGGLSITKDTRTLNKPATSITWIEAAMFVNWLNTSVGSTPAYKFDGSGSFQLWTVGDTGYDPNNLYRNALARYFLPSVDEWYKAAYYEPNSGVYYVYPTGSNTHPLAVDSGTLAGTAVFGGRASPADIMLAGGLSPYGTMAQGGNVSEWEETEYDLVNDSVSSNRTARGGNYGASAEISLLHSSVRDPRGPSEQSSARGFRVASIAIPEPSTLLLAALALVPLAWQRGICRSGNKTPLKATPVVYVLIALMMLLPAASTEAAFGDLLFTLTPISGNPENGFGAVALDGNLALIGARRRNTTASFLARPTYST